MALVEAAPTTEALLHERLAARRTAQKFDPGELRISELGGCPRRTALRLLGYEPQDTTDQQEAIFAAGDEAEEYVAALWRERYPRPNQVRRQVEVAWTLSDGVTRVGHIDIWIAPIRRIVESKSVRATGRRYLPHPEHVDQVTLYLHFWGLQHGASAEIAYYLKETGEVVSVPVEYDRTRAERLIAKAESIVASVQRGVPLPVPDGYTPATYPCGWTTLDGQVATCPFWSYCWAGGNKMRREGGGMPHVEALAEAVRLLAETEAEVRRASHELKQAERRRDAARSVIGEWMDRNGVETFAAGAYMVRRVRRKPSVWYDARAAIEAGVVTEEVMRPFARERAGGEIWTVKEVG